MPKISRSNPNLIWIPPVPPLIFANTPFNLSDYFKCYLIVNGSEIVPLAQPSNPLEANPISGYKSCTNEYSRRNQGWNQDCLIRLATMYEKCRLHSKGHSKSSHDITTHWRKLSWHREEATNFLRFYSWQVELGMFFFLSGLFLVIEQGPSVQLNLTFLVLWPNLKNLSGGLNISRGLNMVGST